MRLTFTRISALLLLLAGTNQYAIGQSPGGVPAPRLWLKSNAGITLNGSNVSAWNDQSTAASNATQATAARQPKFTAQSPVFNNYPSLDLDLVDDGMTLAGTFTNTVYSFFAVYNSTSTSPGARRAVQGTTAAGTNWLIGPYAGVPHFYNGGFVEGGTVGFNGTTPVISTATSNNSYNTTFSYLNGLNITTNTASYTVTTPTTISLGVGSGYAEPMGGSIAEVIAYTSVLGAGQKNQVESYLALKYGISLSQATPVNYVNSAGNTIFNSATGGNHIGYANNVVGIINDNGSGLNQAASKSVNAAGIANISNPSPALANNEYLIFGDNAAAINGRSADVPSGYGNRLNRIWRVSKSGASTVTLKMYIGDIPELVLPNRDLTNVAILSSSTTSFAAAAVYPASSVTGPNSDTLIIPNVSLNDLDYFTLSTGANTAPTAGNGDFEFWFGVPQWSPDFPVPQKLHFTGAAPSSYSYYVIDQPANPSFTPITGTIAPGAAKIIDMSSFVNSTGNAVTDQIVTLPANTIVNRGLRITVKGQMGAYYTNENVANYGSFPLRGPNALGTSFYIPGQNQFVNYPYTVPSTSEFIVTATQDNTTVTITPSEAIVGHSANLPFTLTMQKGQSYQAQSASQTLKHLAGSILTATNPVVVTYSDDLLYTGNGNDNAGDQLVPIARYGTDYVHLKTDLSYTERVFLVGSKANTTVTIFDGTTTRTRVLGAGQMDSVALLAGKSVQFVHADKPILAYQMGGSLGELGSGILTPAMDCKGTRIIAFQYPTAAIQGSFYFVVQDAYRSGFVINGNTTLVQQNDFIPVPGLTGWSYVKKDVTNTFTPGQTVTISNTIGKFFFYQNMKTSGGGDFSNFSDFGNVVLFPKATRPVCAAQPVNLASGAIAYNSSISSYSWSGPNGYTAAVSNPVLSAPTVADSGWYRLTVTDNNSCSYTDSVLVSVPLSTITVTPYPSAACVGSTIRFVSTATPGVAVDSIRWTGPNGFTSTLSSFDITNAPLSAAGTYTATYYDKYGCPKTSSTTITISSSIIGSIAVSGNPKINCTSGPVTLTATSYAQGLKYQTYNPYKATTLYVSNNFTTIAPGFYNQEATASGTLTNKMMDLTGLTNVTSATTNVGVQYDGFLNITQAGSYTFYTSSKDGSNLFIDGNLVVSNDGIHTQTEVASATVNLTAGYHPINVNYYNGPTTAAALTVSYACPACSPAISKAPIPASLLFTPAGTPPALTYTWTNSNNASTTSGTTTTAAAAGTYTLNGSNGGCSSNATFTVMPTASYDYGDLSSAWPSAQAAVMNCTTAGVPSGSNQAVWAGTGVSYEHNIFSDAQAATANIDSYDDGLGAPGSITVAGNYPFTVTMNSNVSGKTVYYGLWFDWNNNGNFADDVDLNGNRAFYSGSGITASPVTVPVTVSVPHGIAAAYKSRLIVSDAPVGFADYANTFSNGEVEDYQAAATPLPVVFGSFSAAAQGCVVQVHFETLSEQGNSHFVIERSTDGASWHTLAVLESQDHAAAVRAYQYTDTATVPGAALYRVRQVDVSGTYTLTNAAKVIVDCDRNPVRIYPNPVRSGSLQVLLPDAYSEAVLQLTNELGQVINVTTSGSGRARTVHTGNLQQGIYLLQVLSEGRILLTQRVTVL